MHIFKKKLRDFNYLLLKCNKVTDKIFSCCFLIDLVLISLLPIQQLLNIEDMKKEGEAININYNLIHIISKHPLFLFLTDAINIVLVILTLLILLGILCCV